MSHRRALLSPIQIAAALLFALNALCGLVAWNVFARTYVFGFDYRIYHLAASHALQGIDPYMPFGQQLDVGASYLYHPAFLLFIAPLTRLDTLLAALVWTGIGVLLLALTWRLLRGRVALRREAGWFLLALLIVSTGLAESLWMGQVNALVVFLITLSVLQSDTRPRLAGVALAIAIVSKTTPVIFIAFFLARRQWSVVLWAMIGAAVLTVAAIIAFGWPIMAQFLTVAVDLGSGSAPDKGVSLAVLLAKLGLPFGLMVWVQRGLAAALILLALVALWRGRPPLLAFAAMLTGMVIVSPLLWGHHLVLAFSAIVIFASYRLRWAIAALTLLQCGMVLVYFSPLEDGLLYTAGWLILVCGITYELWTQLTLRLEHAETAAA